MACCALDGHPFWSAVTREPRRLDQSGTFCDAVPVRQKYLPRGNSCGLLAQLQKTSGRGFSDALRSEGFLGLPCGSGVCDQPTPDAFVTVNRSPALRATARGLATSGETDPPTISSPLQAVWLGSRLAFHSARQKHPPPGIVRGYPTWQLP